MNSSLSFLLGFTFLRGIVPPTYPPSCLFLSSVPLSYNDLTQTNADILCAQRTTCAGTRAFMSFPDEDLVDQYTCSDVGVYACDTFIPLANSTLQAVVEPLYRRLTSAGFPGTQYWSLTSENGDYLPCAIANTETNVYLFDAESASSPCNVTLPVICECIEPNSILDSIIVLIVPYFRYGDIAFSGSDDLARIDVDSWYVLNGNIQYTRSVDRYVSGETIQTNGSFSIERVNEYGPYTNNVYFLQLKGNNETFAPEINLGYVEYNITSSSINTTDITFAVTNPGAYETIVFLEAAAEEIYIPDCSTCVNTRQCICMLYRNASFDISVRGASQLSSSISRISNRYII